MVQAEFEVDMTKRAVTARVKREFDVTPVVLTIPFSVLKGIAGAILVAEGEAEKAASNGGKPRLVTAG